MQLLVPVLASIQVQMLEGLFQELFLDKEVHYNPGYRYKIKSSKAKLCHGFGTAASVLSCVCNVTVVAYISSCLHLILASCPVQIYSLNQHSAVKLFSEGPLLPAAEGDGWPYVEIAEKAQGSVMLSWLEAAGHASFFCRRSLVHFCHLVPSMSCLIGMCRNANFCGM